MNKYLISFGTKDFKNNIILKKFFAKKICGFDEFRFYSPDDLKSDFYQKYRSHFSNNKGYGYFIWKFYLILEVLKKINENDFLFYLDAGAIFLKSPNPLISTMRDYDLDYAGFGLPLLEINWTKKELFNHMKLDFKKYCMRNQLLANALPMFKTKKTINFFKNCFDLASNYNLINDNIDRNIQNPEFIEHRHDQSIFSLSYQKKNMKILKDPSQFGEHPEGYCGYKFLKKPQKKETIFLKNKRFFRILNYPGKYSNLIFLYRTHNLFFCYFRYLTVLMIQKYFYKNIIVR